MSGHPASERAKVIQSLEPYSEERFRALFEQASVGVALESMEGEILHANPAFARLLGYTEQQLKTMRCQQFSHPDDESAEATLFDELRCGRRTSYQVDKRFRNNRGDWVWARVSVSLLKSGEQTPLVVGFIEDIEERRKAEERLKEAKAELEELAGKLLGAQERERRRISRELHDDVGQRMSLITSDVAKIEQELRVERKTELAERAEALKQQLFALATTIHDMCSNLHSTKLDHLGLRAALKDLCGAIFEHNGMSVTLDVDDHADRMQERTALCFYRVAQEALNNAAKHSNAREAKVVAKREGDMICMRIRDYGCGFDPAAAKLSTGIGLASMRERLRSVNGTLMIQTGAGVGTEIIAQVRYSPRKRCAE
jgi:PAS domain S-box-containing protein